MKRGTPHHPKTLALAALLGVDRCVAVGILEGLWHFAGAYARRGDVGRLTDQAIASGLGTAIDASVLVKALLDSGWLDACSCHRLRIHDWPEHADQAVQKTNEVKTRGFLECYASGRPPESSIRPPETVKARPEGVNPPPAQGTGHKAQGAGKTADGTADHRREMLDHQRSEYAEAVWAAFLEKAGLPATRPMDGTAWPLLKNWMDVPVPLAVVLTAIRETKGKGSVLGYYAPSVKAEWDRVRRAVGVA